MPNDKLMRSEMTRPAVACPTCRDQSDSYGWISILLHWIAAAVVIALWVVGSAAASSGGQGSSRLLHLHTTIAVSAYLLLWTRIVWRFWVGHPGPMTAQRGLSFSVGKIVHYVLLILMGIMLLTGPVTLWSGGQPIHVFSLAIPAPWGVLPGLAIAMQSVHHYTSQALIILVLLHVCGALKQVAFNRDGTLAKMLLPVRRKGR
jgi:cytochrome b561